MTGDRVEFDCMGELLDQVYDDLIHFWYLDGELYSYMGYRSVTAIMGHVGVSLHAWRGESSRLGVINRNGLAINIPCTRTNRSYYG